jgi:hypothetical protein
MKSRRELANAQGMLGDDLMLAGRDKEGHQMYMASLKLYLQLLAAEFEDPNYSSMAAHAHYRSGTGFIRLGDAKSARLEFEECMRLRKAAYEGTKDERQRNKLKVFYAFPLARCGKHAEAAEMLATSVRGNFAPDGDELAWVGGCYGVCRVMVGEGKPEAALTPEEKLLRKHYLDLALASFEQARQKNFTDILLLKDADFEPLHGVPEFERWRESFRESLKKKK